MDLCFPSLQVKYQTALLSQFDRILSACERLIAKEENTFQTCSWHLSQRQELWVTLPKISPWLGGYNEADHQYACCLNTDKGWLIGNKKDLFWGEGIKNKSSYQPLLLLGRRKGLSGCLTLPGTREELPALCSCRPGLLLADQWPVLTEGTPPAKLKSSSNKSNLLLVWGDETPLASTNWPTVRAVVN